MPLEQLTERVWYFYGGANCGLILGTEHDAVLVDSGLDAGNAKKLWRPWQEQGWQLAGIVNTHSHTDHIGGNAEMQKRTGALAYAPAPEHLLIQYPEFEPQGLFGGVKPPPTLQVKFLLAAPSRVGGVIVPGRQRIGSVEFEAVPIPGHSPGQVAIAADGVLFVADGCFRPEILARHPVTYLVDVAAYLASLDVIQARPEAVIVPGHGPAFDRRTGADLPGADTTPLLAGTGADPLVALLHANRQAVGHLLDLCRDALRVPAGTEAVLRHVAAALGKVHDNDPSYFLDRAAIHACLSHLTHRGELMVRYDQGERLWSRCGA